MKQIYTNLYIGGDEDYEKVKDKEDWFVVRAAKEGSGGHRDTLQYKERAAPKDSNYYFVERPRKLILNLVDPPHESMVPPQVVDKALEFTRQHLEQKEKVLIACNQGFSRAPSLGLLMLYELGKLPTRSAFSTFRKLYPPYAPSSGMKSFIRQRLKI